MGIYTIGMTRVERESQDKSSCGRREHLAERVQRGHLNDIRSVYTISSHVNGEFFDSFPFVRMSLDDKDCSTWGGIAYVTRTKMQL